VDDPRRFLGEDPEVAEHHAPVPPTLSEMDRAVALLQGPPKMPRRTIGWVLAVCLFLGLGGVIGDHYLDGGNGIATKPSATTRPSPQTDLNAPLSSLMGLKNLSPRPAPAIGLTEADGKRVTLASFLGDVVVLSFFDARCDDICPVLGSELAQAAVDLGARASKVVLLIINTDPLATSTASVSPLVGRVLGRRAHWHFLTGTLRQLNPIWSAYGVTIEVQRSSNLVAHNDVLYFIDPEGRLRLMAVPFADETVHRRFSLPTALEKRWASGIATEAESLLGAPS